MGRRLPAGNDRRQRRLDGIGLQRGPGLQFLGRTRQVAAGADAGDQHVDRRIREVLQDFLRGGAGVDGDVGRVFELLRNPRARRFGKQLVRAFDRALHALSRGVRSNVAP
jgi:hypothetical protein